MAPRILTILTGKTCPKDLTVRRANFHWEAEAGAAAETQSGLVENRFELLLEASKKFTQAMGLHDELMLEFFRAKSDWEFIIKIDAMLEAAAKAVVKKRLNAVPTELGEDLSFDGFVDAVPMNGRTSLLAFLKVDGCPNDVSGFIEAVRRLRNGFAHDIRLTDPRRTTTWFKKGKSWVNATCRRNENAEIAITNRVMSAINAWKMRVPFKR